MLKQGWLHWQPCAFFGQLLFAKPASQPDVYFFQREHWNQQFYNAFSDKVLLIMIQVKPGMQRNILQRNMQVEY